MRWVIGDVHGMLKPLEVLLEGIARVDRQPTLLFVGDYVNRGAESRRTVELLLTLKNARFVRGNHDDIFDLVLHGQCYADNATEGNRIAAMQWFLQHGLDRTFHSYGADMAELEFTAAHPNPQRMQALIELVPATHRAFFRGLPGLVEYPDIFIAHAKWGINDATELPSLAVELSARAGLRHRIIWGRYSEKEIHADKPWERVGFFGHTPVTHYLDARVPSDLVPVIGPQIVLVDTACALSPGGRLTAYCVESRTYLQSDRAGHVIEAGAKR